MMGMPSFGKSKKLQTATASASASASSHEVVSPKAAASPKASKNIEKTSSGKQNMISRITSRASLKSRRTKSESVIQAVRSQKRVLYNVESELENAFNVFDANRDGKISLTELSSVLRSLGNEVSEHDMKLIMKDVDTDHDGYISLREFIEFNKVAATSKHSEDEKFPCEDLIRVAFDTFDKDGNNLISADELQVVLLSLGDKDHTIEDCRRMISNVDQDGDGYVDYKEFQVLMGAKY